MLQACGKLKEKAQRRGEWSRWTIAPAGRQTRLKKKKKARV